MRLVTMRRARRVPYPSPPRRAGLPIGAASYLDSTPRARSRGERPMSQAPRRHLRLETIDDVTVVSFVDAKIVTDENIQEVGDQLYSLVEHEGPRRLLLNIGNVQYLSSAALGKLINL